MVYDPDSKRRKKRDSNLRYRYNITADEFDAMAEEQGWRCSICNDRPKKGLVVDHSHSTKEVRGLICGYCNIALGFLKDHPIIIHQAAIYIERHRRGDGNNRHQASEGDC